MDRSAFIESPNGLRDMIGNPQPDYPDVVFDFVKVRSVHPVKIAEQPNNFGDDTSENLACYIGYGATVRVDNSDTLAEAVRFQFVVPVTIVVTAVDNHTLVKQCGIVQDYMDFVISQMRDFQPEIEAPIILEAIYIRRVDPATGGLSSREALFFQIVFEYQDLSHI